MRGVRTLAVISLADLKPAALDHSAIIAYFIYFYLVFIHYDLISVNTLVACALSSGNSGDSLSKVRAHISLEVEISELIGLLKLQE